MKRKRGQNGIVLAVLWVALTLTVAAQSMAAAPARAQRPDAATATQDAPVDVNSASEQQLMAVPGIGEGLAKRIVQFRDKNGRFENVDDLMKVQGIGEKSIEKLRPYLVAAKPR